MTITVRANLKALRIRPAREPGDKPVLEVVLRTEVDPTSFYLAAKAGKEMTVDFIPDPELQPSLPLDEPERGLERANGVEHEPGSPESTGISAGRRKRGTRSSEGTPSA